MLLGAKLSALLCFGLFAAMCGIASGQQQGVPTADAYQAIWMPRDRFQAARQVYSAVLETSDVAGIPLPAHWLIRNMTGRVEPDAPCTAKGAEADVMNPHVAVTAPPGGERDLAEMLADFDRHCHDLIQLEVRDFAPEAHVRLLDADQQARFQHLFCESKEASFMEPNFDPRTVWAPPPPAPAVDPMFVDADGPESLSEPYFNRQHTVVMVSVNSFCRSGRASWVVLQRQHGRWQRVGWRTQNLTLN